jgi:hypothetical protein
MITGTETIQFGELAVVPLDKSQKEAQAMVPVTIENPPPMYRIKLDEFAPIALRSDYGANVPLELEDAIQRCKNTVAMCLGCSSGTQCGGKVEFDHQDHAVTADLTIKGKAGFIGEKGICGQRFVTPTEI